jgi:hypothetical protein
LGGLVGRGSLDDLGDHGHSVEQAAPPEWIREGAPFTFIIDGVESAIRLAKKAARDKDVQVSRGLVP